MKLLSIAIPSYNSQDYLSHAVESLLPGGDEVEILIINDGSTDDTARIADAYAKKYPTIVRTIHKENGGHGDAVMTGIKNAKGLYFKVVDSDDWVDEKAFPKVLQALREHVQTPIDLVISNYIYDKVGAKNKRVIRYANALPENRVLGWNDVKRFHIGQYILMHAAIYRTQLLVKSGLSLPKHTFYVDSLYVYVPMQHVRTLLYLNVDFYHYFIGREDQSVQEAVMLKRIDQQLLVNKMMMQQVDLTALTSKAQWRYMRNYLEIITTISSALLIKSGTDENRAKHHELWQYFKENTPVAYKAIRRRPLGVLLHVPGRLGQHVVKDGYRLSRHFFGFN